MKTKLITIDYDEYLNLLKTHKQISNDVLSNLNNILLQYQKDYPNNEINLLITNLLCYIKTRIDK